MLTRAPTMPDAEEITTEELQRAMAEVEKLVNAYPADAKTVTEVEDLQREVEALEQEYNESTIGNDTGNGTAGATNASDAGSSEPVDEDTGSSEPADDKQERRHRVKDLQEAELKKTSDMLAFARAEKKRRRYEARGSCHQLPLQPRALPHRTHTAHGPVQPGRGEQETREAAGATSGRHLAEARSRGAEGGEAYNGAILGCG